MRNLGTFLLALGLAALAGIAHSEPGGPLPPPSGPTTPRVEPIRGEDGIFRQAWYTLSFLDMAEDFSEAKAAGRRFAVVFEQRGCIYCTRMHTEVLAQRYINDYVAQNFRIVQIDLWGSREVTDFDGAKMSEKKLAERWGVMFTPTIVFFKDELPAEGPRWGAPLEVTRMMLGIGAPTFYDMFVWIRTRTYEQDRNFQRFHIARSEEREKLGKGQ